MKDVFITALIGFLGVIIGTVITSIINIKVKTKETRLRIIEKVFDKRIQAHENILFLVKSVRTVITIDATDEENHLVSFPYSMESHEKFNEFKDGVFTTIHQNSHWLNIEVVRELGFLQDYLSTLKMVINEVREENMFEVGLIIKQDFIDLATSVENIAFEFFRNDIYKMSINTHSEWHKYPKDVTYERIHKTLLFTKRDEIDNLNEK